MFALPFAARRCAGLLLALLGPAAYAQAPAGNGLEAIYYDGINFDRPLVRRRDATIDFNWGHGEPAPGVSAEYFSVRWQGWLLPPATGRYLLHATVDDGMRVWLNDKLVLDEWRPQEVRTFTVAVELKANTPYRLRVEYFQDVFDTRARLTWERPDQPKAAAPPDSWRNLWGLVEEEKPGPEPIPARYLFAQPPTGAASQRAASPPAAATPPPAATRRAAATASDRTSGAARTAPAATARTAPAVGIREPDSTAQRAARLATGEALTLPDLRFDQGQAQLLPAARRTLDGLLPVLRQRPGLRLEIQGHTDNVGDASLNQLLSQRRAEAVRDYLVGQGVPAAQLRAVGYGGTQPVADNTDPGQRPRNRRVVLRRL